METLDFSTIDQWETTPNFDGLGLDKRRCQVRVFLINYLADYRIRLRVQKARYKRLGIIPILGCYQGVHYDTITFLRGEIEAVKKDLRNARKIF